MVLSSGIVLNQRYRIVKLLGKGGFGAVYRAWDIKLNGPCALKESLDTSPPAQKQFNREASLLFNLRHSSLPRVFDSFVVEGQGQYLVMDFVEGDDLSQLLEQMGSPLPEDQVMDWVSQICEPLIYMHSQAPPIIHRDIKPANIKITPGRGAVLVDFGIAKAYDPELKTTVGARAVTPGYSPQEQYGQGSTDARSDVYSLGATMYALLTYEEPVESIQRALGQKMPHPRTLNPKISVETEGVIMKAMELQSARRYQSMSEMKSALAASKAVQGEKVFSPGAVVAPLKKPVARTSALPQQSSTATTSFVAGILAVLFSLIAGAATLLTFGLGSLLFFLPLIPSVVSVVAASRAKKQMRQTGYQGEYLRRASSGQIMGWLGLGVSILLMCAGCAFWGIVMIDSV